MSNILKSPAKYVQGAGVLRELDRHLSGMGSRLLIIISESGIKRIRQTLDECFAGKEFTLCYEIFKGECSRRCIDLLVESSRKNKATVIVGIGGGKILDTAKAAAFHADLPVVIVPTVASTDSPCSSLSVIYHDNGEFDQYLYLKKCPDMVLVDTAVIVKAPVSLLIAGMGDAMATWFEARACRASGSNNQVAGRPTIAASGLARMCWDNLKRYGLQAKKDLESGLCSEAVEAIVEVNTYLSSVGFESGGLAAAHAIQKGFTFIPELHALYHGYKVAFCTITQLVLENADHDELEEVLDFCLSVGLPICFADMGYESPNLQLLYLAAEKSCASGSTIHNLPFSVTPRMVYEAMLQADRLGVRHKG